LICWYRFDPAGDLILKLHVQPGAKKTEVAGLHGDALKIRLAAPPVEGKANLMLTKFLAEHFVVPLNHVTLVSGEHSRHKLVCIRQTERDPGSLLGE